MNMILFTCPIFPKFVVGVTCPCLSPRCWYFRLNDICWPGLLSCVWPRVSHRVPESISRHIAEIILLRWRLAPGVRWGWCVTCHRHMTNKSPSQCFFFLICNITRKLSVYLYLNMKKIWSSIHLEGWIKSDCLGKPRKINRKQKVNNICLASLWLKYPENIPDSIPDGSSPAPSIVPLTFSRRGILIKFSVSGQHSTALHTQSFIMIIWWNAWFWSIFLCIQT